jgi:hypothetical protein
MEQFDSEVEKALNRAGKASGWLTVLAVAMLILSIVGGVLGGAGVALGGFAGAALIYGVAVIINLLGMQLVVSWGQIRQNQDAPK